MTKTRPEPIAPLYADVVVVACACGMFPLGQATHASAQAAWRAAARHVALNADCRPRMFRDTVPVALAGHTH